MTRRILAVILAVFMIAAVFTGCGGVKSSKDSVTALFGSEPTTIDPALNQTLDGGTYISHLFEGLTRNDEGNIVPGVAEKWDISTDGLVYTFHIRGNAKWSDGQPVKAQDFEYAWKRALDPKTASPYNYILFYLKNGEKFSSGEAKAEDVGVKAKDDKTLEVTLEAPTTFFLELCAFMTYMPVRQDIVEKNGDQWTQKAETYVSNGAFKMKEWKHNDEIVVEKSDNYWDKDKILLKEIHFKLMDDEAAALTATEAGEIDVNYAHVPTTEIPRLQKENKIRIISDLSTYYYDFNTKMKPFDDARVRKAFAMAIDRQYIVEKVTQAGQKPATGWVCYGFTNPDTKKDYREEGGDFLPKSPTADDLAKAKQLLADAGYPDGKGLPEIELKYNTSESHKLIAEAVQEQLKKNLGVSIKVVNEEWKVFVTDRNEKKFHLARDGWGTDYSDPISFIDTFVTGGGNNNTNWGSEAYDKLVQQAKSTADQKVRFKAMHDAEKIMMDEMPILPVYFYTKTLMENPQLKGNYASPLGFYFLHHAYFQ